jgi:hypothetical protein
LKKEDLPYGEGWYRVWSGCRPLHTHLDAPWHFASTMDHGKRAITTDEVPLEWCFQPGVKFDFRHSPDGYGNGRRRRRTFHSLWPPGLCRQRLRHGA